MDIYDFDGTLYEGDSTADFLLWAIKRHPDIILTLPRTAAAAVALLAFHAIDKTQFKRALYRFLPHIPDIESETRLFWKAHMHKIGGPCHPLPGDLVISASPEFLLRSVCAKRGLGLIASQVDPHTGNVLGPNCSNEEKIVRFREAFPTAKIERFYSDSRNDDPLALLAQEAFLVKDGKLFPWPHTATK